MNSRSIFWAVLTVLFVGLVAHAASRESSTCPLAGSCESIHRQLMKGPPPLTADAPPREPFGATQVALGLRSH